MRFLAFAMPDPTPWRGMGHVAGAADLHNQDYARALLAWYDRDRRILPWRAAPGVAPDPYRVWLSEIMLQQTTVKAVLPRYADFLRRWPDVTALAAAELGEVLAAWAGLGYYARARNLHACAREVVARHGGHFPATEAELRTLPGIGDYTAAAIAAIAFGARATPIDGNIERVVARLFAVATPLPAAKPEIRSLAAALTPDERAGDFAQSHDGSRRHALQPAPACLRTLSGRFRLRESCSRLGGGSALSRGKGRSARRGAGSPSWRCAMTARCCLRERPLKGLLGGMLETPSSPWTERGESANAALEPCPAQSAMARGAGARRAHLHALPPRAFSLFRRGLGRSEAQRGRTSRSAAAGSMSAIFTTQRCRA